MKNDSLAAPLPNNMPLLITWLNALSSQCNGATKPILCSWQGCWASYKLKPWARKFLYVTFSKKRYSSFKTKIFQESALKFSFFHISNFPIHFHNIWRQKGCADRIFKFYHIKEGTFSKKKNLEDKYLFLEKVTYFSQLVNHSQKASFKLESSQLFMRSQVSIKFNSSQSFTKANFEFKLGQSIVEKPGFSLCWLRDWHNTALLYLKKAKFSRFTSVFVVWCGDLRILWG